MIRLVLALFAAADEGGLPIPVVSQGFSILAALGAIYYVVRFQTKYVRPLEQDRAAVKKELADAKAEVAATKNEAERRVAECEAESEHRAWQITFLTSIMTANGLRVPNRFYTDNWRREPPRVIPEEDDHQ